MSADPFAAASNSAKPALHFAFEYYDRGWPVIPVVGKTPATSWKAYQRKKPSLRQIREWFASEHSEPVNIAIVTGSVSGLVVVDCDTQADADWWQRSFPVTPLIVLSGGGGRHFYYRHPGNHVGNSTRVLGRQIDIRGDGGLAVAPPSVHPDTEQAYRWNDDRGYAIETVPLFDGAWVKESPIRPTLTRPSARRQETTVRDGIAYIGLIHATAGQGGHSQTFRAACKLRDSGLSAEEALAALIEWNETNASPPWSAKELAHKVNDAYRQI